MMIDAIQINRAQSYDAHQNLDAFGFAVEPALKRRVSGSILIKVPVLQLPQEPVQEVEEEEK